MLLWVSLCRSNIDRLGFAYIYQVEIGMYVLRSYGKSCWLYLWSRGRLLLLGSGE